MKHKRGILAQKMKKYNPNLKKVHFHFVFHVKSILISGCLFTATLVVAQRNTVASGGEATGSGGTVSYTVGQIDYISSTGSSGSVNQGVQQPYEFFTVGIESHPGIQLQAVVYPNPTTDFVQLKIESENLTGLSWQLYDLNGKRIASNVISSTKTNIPMYSLRAATYFLRVTKNQQAVKTFKIIKHK